MNLKKFTASFDQMMTTTFVSLITNVVLAVAVSLLVWNKVTEEPIIQLVPPNLTAEAKVGARSADAAYLMSFGLYVASMTGNVTPKNVLFVADAISPFIDSRIYPEVRKQMFALAADPTFKERGGSVSFEAQDISYDAPSNKVFVIGEQISKTTSGEQQRSRYVYELVIEIKNRQPMVMDIDHYTGAPRTAKWLKNQGRRPGQKKTEVNDATEAEPWFDAEARFGTLDSTGH